MLTEDDMKVHMHVMSEEPVEISYHFYGKAVIDDNYFAMTNQMVGADAVVWTLRKDIFSSFKVNGEELITEDTEYMPDWEDDGSDMNKTMSNALFAFNPSKGEYDIDAIVKPEVDDIRYVFMYCPYTEMTIPNSVTSIGGGAFRHCKNLTSVEIPNSVTSISDYAFDYCSSLTSVTIPNSVTSIGNRAFAYCSSLTSVTIPNSVTSIGEGAFWKCSSLTSITYDGTVEQWNAITKGHGWHEDVPSIYVTCLDGVVGVTNYLNTYSDGTQKYENIISDNKTLVSTVIEDSVTSIDNHAFQNCTSLTSVTIPNSVTNIGDWTFDGCSSLTSIEMPNSVTRIGISAFARCSSLASISYNGTVEQWNAITKGYSWHYNVPSTTVVSCSGGTVALD